MTVRTDDILDAIRKAIEHGDVTRYRIAKDTGLNESQLCKIMKGDAGLSLESLTILANYLDLEIIIRARPRRKTDGKHQSR
jgi:hypothetical protein